MRKIFIVEYKASNNHKYCSYLLANNAGELDEIMQSYHDNDFVIDPVIGVSETTNATVVLTKPTELFERYIERVDYETLKKLTHGVIFLLGRLESKGTMLRGLHDDTGLVHELIHLLLEITPLEIMESVHTMMDTLRKIESALPELFFTEEEQDYYRGLK